MEVRMSEFAEIVGTSNAAIRNALQLNKFPAGRPQREVDNDDKITRRTYSVADAFGWFLHEQMARGLSMSKVAAASNIKGAWAFGLNWFIQDRMARAPSGETYLILHGTLPTAPGIATEHPQWQSYETVGDRKSLDQALADYPVVQSIHLEPVFELFEKVLLLRGWGYDKDGFVCLEELGDE